LWAEDLGWLAGPATKTREECNIAGNYIRKGTVATMNDEAGGNYMGKVRAALQKANFPPGALVRVDIEHDDGCGYWRGGPCDCDPAVSLERVGAFVIGMA
jgi:hypothetical protein